MIKIFGEFSDRPINTTEYLIMGFSPTSVSLQQRWRNNGLSADFLADYLTTFFPAEDSKPTTFERREEIKGAVSYIANELLENSMKFNDGNSQSPISIQFQLHSDRFMLCTSNSVPKENVEGFQSFIQELLHCEPQELYIRQIARAKEKDNMTTNSTGLGLLTMLDDYNAKLGWKFETIQQDKEVIVVTTMVQLVI